MMLTSSRLKYSFINETHLNDLYELSANPEVMKFIRAPIKTFEETLPILKKYQDYMAKCPGLGVFVAQERDTDIVVGLGFLINLEMNPENKDVEVGYRLHQKAWGKGYATEIAETLIKYGVEQLNLKEIFGTTHVDHEVSQKVLMKVGLKDHGFAHYYGQQVRFFRYSV